MGYLVVLLICAHFSLLCQWQPCWYCIHSVVRPNNGFFASSSKTADRIEKVMGGGCKIGVDLLYHHAKYGGDRGSRAGCRRKMWFFIFVCLFVTLWNDWVCDNGNAMKQYNFQNNYGVIALRKVCSCAPIFNFFCGPTESCLGDKFLPKITIFCNFGSNPAFFKPQWWNLAWGCAPGTPFSKPNLVKNHLRGYTPFWAILYQKNTNFGGCKPTF